MSSIHWYNTKGSLYNVEQAVSDPTHPTNQEIIYHILEWQKRFNYDKYIYPIYLSIKKAKKFIGSQTDCYYDYDQIYYATKLIDNVTHSIEHYVLILKSLDKLYLAPSTAYKYFEEEIIIPEGCVYLIDKQIEPYLLNLYKSALKNQDLASWKSKFDAINIGIENYIKMKQSNISITPSYYDINFLSKLLVTNNHIGNYFSANEEECNSQIIKSFQRNKKALEIPVYINNFINYINSLQETQQTNEETSTDTNPIMLSLNETKKSLDNLLIVEDVSLTQN